MKDCDCMARMASDTFHWKRRNAFKITLLPSCSHSSWSLLIILLLVSGVNGWLVPYSGDYKYQGFHLNGKRIRNSIRPRSIVCLEETKANGSHGPGQPQPQPPPQKQQRTSWMGADQLNHLKEQVDIISMIESYQLDQFKRTGPNRATALCPFHDDHNPSLSIDGDRRLYKCFACGAGGDIFRFVREYNKVRKGEDMSFMKAVNIVNDYYTASGGGNILISSSSIHQPTQRMTEEEHQAMQAKKERLIAINTAAAAYYVNCLTLPFAGGARHYLLSRGFQSPATARAFALGYATDTYFTQNKFIPKSHKSLVDFLRGQNYTASEILDAGLAVRTKKSTNELEDNQGATNATTIDSKQAEVDFDSIMDRFRGRLMVPIFDDAGEKVVAFGGRILPEADVDRPNFKPPKYLNSAESLIFSKKNILFGYHMVIDAYQRIKNASKTKRPAKLDPLTVVEGYMDVMALWDIGYRTSVASMGTAISLEQLIAASKIASAQDGRVVLCLDNDEAGIAAVERLCTGSFFLKAAASYNVQFLIASLPIGIKDPGDFIEFHLSDNKSNSKDVVHEFRTDVIDRAKDWSDWFLGQILSRYDKSAPREGTGSFGGIFQRVAEFLATFPNPAYRTKSAYMVADKLATIMAEENNSTSVSNAARMQLESDLIDSAARIANAKDAMKQRVESSNGAVSPSDTNKLLSSFSQGISDGGLVVDTDKLSYKALKAINSPQVSKRPKSGPISNVKAGSLKRMAQRKMQDSPPIQKRKYTPVKKQREESSLTPHFSGFEFENQSDADWLGIPRNKWKRNNHALIAGEFQYDSDTGTEFQGGKRSPQPVYFNSNDYHGHRFVTPEALQAGYSDMVVSRDDQEIREKGVSILIAQENDSSLIAAETALLRSLVLHYPNSRNAVKDVLMATSSVGPNAAIQWSSYDRKWLFTCLVEEDLLLDGDDEIHPGALRALLAARDDVPPGAFGNMNDAEKNQDEIVPSQEEEENKVTRNGDFAPHTTSEIPPNTTSDEGMGHLILGSLGIYFAPMDDWMKEVSMLKNDSDQVLALKEKSALSAQEHFMAVLSASATKRQRSIKQELNDVSFALQARAAIASLDVSKSEDSPVLSNGMNNLDATDEQSTTSPSQMSPKELDDLRKNLTIMRYQGMSDEELSTYCKGLLLDLQNATEHVHSIRKSTKRITERLMRFSSGTSEDKVEGRISVPLQKKLARHVDDFIAEIERNKTVFESTTNNDEYFDFLEAGYAKEDEVEGGLEAELQEIEAEWGDWSSDDYIWEPDHAGVHGPPRGVPKQNYLEDKDALEDEDDETLEEALERMDSEWSNWASDD